MLNLETLFPLPPYPSQIHLASQIYQQLGKKKLFIIESPTGSGKSLTLICSVFQFLLENEYNYDLLEIDAKDPANAFKRNIFDLKTKLDKERYTRRLEAIR